MRTIYSEHIIYSDITNPFHFVPLCILQTVFTHVPTVTFKPQEEDYSLRFQGDEIGGRAPQEENGFPKVTH